MPGSSNSSEDGWLVPVLDRAGQQAFWDRQAPDYEHADMTRDNEGELDLVRALCQQFCVAGYQAHDIVTLGGAVGSRDPKVVVETLALHSKKPERIYFNDLSEKMTDQALKSELSSYTQNQIGVTAIPGAIHEISERISHRPRRVIIGVYRAEAFTEANPHYGYPLTGLAEYDKNADKIGTHLSIETVHLANGEYQVNTDRIDYFVDQPDAEKLSVQAQLIECVRINSIDAIRIVGRHQNQDGYFLSHWFTQKGIRQLVTESFDPERIASMSLMACAKGFVVCIDPIEPPQGVVTILNNVIGNILPDEQVRTLRAINTFSR